MSQTKAQLIQPIGVVTASGVVVTGVVTASSFDGEVVGSATSIISGGNLNLGDVNATTFSGDFTGNATGINTGADIKVGSFTATNFTGDFTGTATSMMRGTGFKAGAVNATGFVANVEGNVTGNVTGNVSVAGSVASGSNIHVGVITATSYSGDGSNLSGIAATNYNTQTVTAIGAATTMDVSAGNIITFNHSEDTTVSFANTSEAMDVTVIRKQSTSFTSGAVTFDGTDDTLTLAASSDFTFDGDFTVEGWFYSTYSADYDTLWGLGQYAGVTPNDGVAFYFGSNLLLTFYSHGSTTILGPAMPQNQWTHIAIVRSGSTVTMYVNGTNEGTATESDDFGSGSNNTFNIGTSSNASSTNVDFFEGKISNLRVVKGTAVYTSNFNPPYYQLTDITNTKLLCCQDTSSATTAAVKPGTITAVSSPTAASDTIANSSIPISSAITLTWPSSVQWNGGSAPTLITDSQSGDSQQFQFITRDSGVTWYAWEPYKRDVDILTLFTWGKNEAGQLGQNQSYAQVNGASSPMQVPGEWKSVEVAYEGASVGGIKSDGTLWMWGANRNGSAGINESGPAGISSPIQVGTDTTWALQSSADEARLAVKTDGTLWSWGYNTYGGLGQNNTTKYSSPVQIPGTNWSTSGNQQVSVSKSSSGAIKADGTLWVWGRNSHGTLGQNESSPGDSYSSPVQIPGSWSNVALDYRSGQGVKTDGTLWSWGYNASGEAGINQDSTISFSSPVQVGTDTNWSISGGKGKTWKYALKTNGTMWAYGNGGNGVFGQGVQDVERSSPIQIPGTTWKINEIIRGQSMAAGLKTDGTLWVWGMNEDGMLGRNLSGGAGNISSPVQIPGTAWHTLHYGYGGSHMAATQKRYS